MKRANETVLRSIRAQLDARLANHQRHYQRAANAAELNRPYTQQPNQMTERQSQEKRNLGPGKE